eukprot:1328256-Prymnesium_polylepis.1
MGDSFRIPHTLVFEYPTVRQTVDFLASNSPVVQASGGLSPEWWLDHFQGLLDRIIGSSPD